MGRKDEDDEPQREVPKVELTEQMILISSLIAEADVLMRLYQYPAADRLYSKAIELQPENLHLLMCRSRCRALNGNSKGSLEDANAILKLDPKNVTGLLCKADAFFAEGDFENAMVWYYRGQAVRPDHDEFAHGIIRSRVAIERALNAFDVDQVKDMLKRGQKIESERKQAAIKKPTHEDPVLDHNLLEELFEDYCFLQTLEEDGVFCAASEGTVKDLVSGAVRYLDDRLDFWRARNPKGMHDITVLEQTVHSDKPRAFYQKLGVKKHAVLPKIKPAVRVQ
ncbi:hypothetical protein EDD86DRAFT_13176 [Gorgonomyces haynaldii]|nr:hypothetical protein EDD86DRAFT_13176 [Gorgonomyces haynaldii]